MADRKKLAEQNDTPEDVATLYSWANLHGAKYRDFSASRALVRERARQRVQEAVEQERNAVVEDAPALNTSGKPELSAAEPLGQVPEFREPAGSQAPSRSIPGSVVTSSVSPRGRQPIGSRAPSLSGLAQTSVPRAPFPVAPNPVSPVSRPVSPAMAAGASVSVSPSGPGNAPSAESYGASAKPAPSAEYAPAAMPAPVASYAAESPVSAPKYEPPVEQAAPARYASGHATAERFGAAPSLPEQPGAFPAEPAYQASFPPRQVPAPTAPPVFTRDESTAPPRQWTAVEPRESLGRPAWLTSIPDALTAPPIPPAPEDTLQGSRERLASRWFALKGAFQSSAAVSEPAPAPASPSAPVMAVFSLAGGVGKTSIAATLGRALSSRGERVLLVDTASYGLLPFFFGARDQRPGVLRTFTPPGAVADAPIQMISLDPEALQEKPSQDPLTSQISALSRVAHRVIVDLATASGSTTRRVLRLSPVVLVPVVPDMNSVVSVGSIDSFFRHNVPVPGQQTMPYYVLNRFDPSLPLHLDVREVLREQLGDRLLPFVLHRTPAMSEALAEGMTAMDYAPNSPVAEDFGSLAGWVKSLSAPASTAFRGVRWSER